MAIICCPECGSRISSFAEFCPQCGLPKEFFDKERFNAEVNNTSAISDASDSLIVKPSVDNLANILKSFSIDYSNFFSNREYISNSLRNNTFARYDLYFNTFCCSKEQIEFIMNNSADLRIDKKDFMEFVEKMRKLDYQIKNHNEKYVDSALQDNKVYFDNILKDVDPNIRLDDEQRRAIVTDDDHCLLIAGAGAGKTTTMAAKVKWLVEKQNINPEEIMLISFTNKAIDELKDRINKKLKIAAKICTFHSSAFEILKGSVSKRPEVCFNQFGIIADMVENKVFTNKEFMHNLVLFLGYYFNIPEEALKFKNLEEYHIYKSSMDFETFRDNLSGYINKVSTERMKAQTTIKGQRLRSAAEVTIANFLYLNGIEYEYEKVYDHRIDGARKEYTPDFYIFQDDKEAYIEHWGINENFTSNIYNASQIARYKKSIFDKREIHKKYNTLLLETWNSYNDGTSIVSNLENQLRKNGFKMKKRDLQEVYKEICTTGKNKYFYKFVMFVKKFIELFKTAGYKSEDFNNLRKRTDNVRTLLFLDIAEDCYNYYQGVLKNTNRIDFADMINEAAELLASIENIQQNDIKLPYKYIIIDEFQDIATQRFNFAKKLSEITGAKVVAVGDDWQSIYSFAGADISLFTKFIDLLGSGTQMQITHTYRNSQELIDIAGDFVQKNSSQIKKKLISPKHIDEPILVNSYDDSSRIMYNLAQKTEEVIGKIIAEYGENSSILLIGRYGFDGDKLVRTELFKYGPGIENGRRDVIICNKYPEAKLTFLTAHSSKGLGYDNVIIINMNEGKFGFPSQIANDPIIKLVTHEDISMEFAEERRLFYVALTRTKNRVYIVAPRLRPSRFLIELINNYKIKPDVEINMDIVKIYDKRCPVCGYPLKIENNRILGLKLWVCTNEPEICDFMTNSDECMKDIFKCNKCASGYMIVKRKKDEKYYFYGCTNYKPDGSGCGNIINFDEIKP